MNSARPIHSNDNSADADVHESFQSRDTYADEQVDEGARRLSKIWSNQPSLSIPVSRPTRPQSPDTVSLISADDFHELRRPSIVDIVNERRPSPSRISRWKDGTQATWTRNKGLFLVLLAQVFGTLMNVTTRILEVEGNNGEGLHPFQILFARMGITVVISMLYMHHQAIPGFPFGAREVRPLLVARGVGGFFGVYCLYWSLQYLPLADATVITFLAPIVTCWLCSKILAEAFTLTDKLAGCISLLGVVLIARPSSFFSSSDASGTVPNGGDVRTLLLHRVADAAKATTATTKQRLAAVAVALLGVCGAACAYTTIRWIGRRAHPLISVNYFAAWCTFVSTVALLALPRVGYPEIGFTLPATLREWALLLFIGVTGFAMQFLLTAGLRYEKSSRATNMVYSQMLFALFFDKVVFGTTPNAWSVVGSGLILGAAVWVAVQKEATKARDTVADEEALVLSELLPEEELGGENESDFNADVVEVDGLDTDDDAANLIRDLRYKQTV